jgi:hypothetical protein
MTKHYVCQICDKRISHEEYEYYLDYVPAPASHFDSNRMVDIAFMTEVRLHTRCVERTYSESVSRGSSVRRCVAAANCVYCDGSIKADYTVRGYLRESSEHVPPTGLRRIELRAHVACEEASLVKHANSNVISLTDRAVISGRSH